MQRLLLILSLYCLAGCSRDNDLAAARRNISGTWELVRYSGFPFTAPVLPPGNGNLLVLDAAGHMERRKHDTVLFRGTYSLQHRKDCGQRPTDLWLNSADLGGYRELYVEVEEAQLVLGTSNCLQDGGASYFRRIK